MQGDMDFGIEQMECMAHLHVQPVVRQRDAPVFRLHHVDAYDQRVFGGKLETANQLDKDCWRGQRAKHLVEEAHLDFAGWRGLTTTPAMLPLAAVTFALM